MAEPQQPDSPPQPVARTSGLAVAALTLACVAAVLAICSGFLAIFPAIPAVVCGHLGRRECERDPLLGGSGFALAGLILGYISLGIGVMSMLGLVVMILVAVLGNA